MRRNKTAFIVVVTTLYALLLPMTATAQSGEETEEGAAEEARSSDAAAEEDDADCPGAARRRIDLGGEVTVASTYVFRGVMQYGSPSIPSFQPAFWLDFSSLLPGSLRFDFWSALAMAKRDRVSRQGSATELDLSLTYEIDLLRDWLQLGGGFLYYLYPGEEQVDGEKELFLTLGLGNLPIDLGVTFWLQVHPDVVLTIEPSVGWEQVFGDFTVGVELVLGTHVGSDGDSGVDYTTFTLGVDHAIGRMSVGLALSYTLHIAPPGLDFLDRSILHGALRVGFGS